MGEVPFHAWQYFLLREVFKIVTLLLLLITLGSENPNDFGIDDNFVEGEDEDDDYPASVASSTSTSTHSELITRFCMRACVLVCSKRLSFVW